MGIKTGYIDLFWGYLGNFLRFGASMIVLPLALHLLPSNEMGIWYVFQTLNAFVALMDFGFSVTLTRNFSYAFSGVKDLVKVGIVKTSKDSAPNWFLFWNIFREAKKIYFIISTIAIVLISSFGSIYIYKISAGRINVSYVFTAWVFFLLALFINLYYGYWNSVLTGIGKVKQYQKANSISGFLYVIVALIGLLTGHGLVALSLAFLVSGFSIRIICKYFFKVFLISKNTSIVAHKSIGKYNGLFSILWHNAKRNGITSIGNYLIEQFNVLFIPVFLGLPIAATYGICMQISRLLRQFGNIPLVVSIAEINSLRAEDNKEQLRKRISLFYCLGVVIVVFGSLFVIAFGNEALKLIKAKTLLPDPRFLIVFMIATLFEWSNNFFCSIITTENKVPYMKSSIISGILIPTSAYFLLRFSTLDLYSVVFPQIIIQGSYNYWRWHLWVLKDLKMNYFSIYKNGIFFLKKNKLSFWRN